MKKLLKGKILQMLPVPNGVVAALLTDITEDDRMVVEYRMISAETNEVSRVSKNVFLLVKFGPGHRAAEMQVNNHLTCRACVLDNGKTFIVEEDASAKLLSEDGVAEWVGSVKYKDEVPCFLTFDGKNIWVSFTEHNTLIRMDVAAMREELRIGGRDGDKNFDGPAGIFADGEDLYVTNEKSKKIWKINTKTFSAEEYAKLDFAVHGIAHFDYKDIIWLDNGIYEL